MEKTTEGTIATLTLLPHFARQLRKRLASRNNQTRVGSKRKSDAANDDDDEQQDHDDDDNDHDNDDDDDDGDDDGMEDDDNNFDSVYTSTATPSSVVFRM